MSSLYLGFLMVLIFPLVAASWRLSILGLGLQGLLMAWIVARHGPPESAGALLSLVDVGLVRGVLVPLLLYRVMSAQAVGPRNDVIPPNMISWTVAGVLIAVAFRFASRVAPVGEEQTAIAVATSGVLLGMFVLATQTGPFSQAVGALRIENAIALFELSGGGHDAPLAVHVGMMLVFLLTASLLATYVRRLQDPVPDFATPRPPL